MRHPTRFVAVFLLLLVPAAALAQPALPIANPVDLPRLRGHVRDLLKALDGLGAPLSADAVKELKPLLEPQAEEEAPEVSLQIQRALDRHCLAGVTINPQSRVKVARGPRAAELRRDREVVLLFKVNNDAGVTQPLAITGPQVRSAKDDKEGGKWLEVIVHREKPLARGLGGNAVEYVVVRFTAREAGKREATLKLDVGQGTQDLGFRAELPILFTVKAD